ncbi:hypothetical protein DLAC_02444 [Tieghemostelium lacteum]|uniref:Uncharacterized protein n=1 Tax=Tieghemostelium lacteum TaxID=361077 RepID=A0A152A2L3_TIELA|nr:hypothetical protein DLAC_02444 [Tieghemostelium lacteum]|eukprot:KYR00449.1 hypothetical protein DLAC_02444 [Tieghemostelium lacteum]
MVLRLSGDRIPNSLSSSSGGGSNISNSLSNSTNSMTNTFTNTRSNDENLFYKCIFKNKFIWNKILSFLFTMEEGTKRYYEIKDATWLCENRWFSLLRYKLQRFQQQITQYHQPASPSKKLTTLNISSSQVPVIAIQPISIEMIELEYELSGWSKQCFELIFKYSTDLDLIKLLHSNFWKKKFKEFYKDIDAIDYSAQSGSLEITKYFHDIGKSATKAAITMAAANGHLSIVRYLNTHRQEGCTKQAMDMASEGGHLEIVRYLHENRQEGCTVSAINQSAKNGHVQVVEFLLSHRLDELLQCQGGDKLSAMDYAAAGGNLKILKLLHQYFGNGVGGCTTNAMDCASSLGDLEMVKFLHFNRSEGCTKSAMNTSALGHLEVLKFLHYHRTEGCTLHAINVASFNNSNLECVEFLLKNRLEGFSKNAVINASEYGQLSILKCLYQNLDKMQISAKPTITLVPINIVNNQGETIVSNVNHHSNNNRTYHFLNFTYNRIVRHGHLEVLQYLYDLTNNNNIENSNFNNQLIETAVEFNRLSILEFLYNRAGLVATPKALRVSVNNNHIEIVKFLISQTNGSTSALLTFTEALEIAKQKGHTEIVNCIESMYLNISNNR